MRYFEDEKEWQRFYDTAITYLGTPFLHMGMVKGRGVDCCTFLALLFKEFGILKKINIEYYPTNWYLTNPFLLKETLENHLFLNLRDDLTFSMSNISNRDVNRLYRGDIGLIWTQVKGIATHAAVYLGRNLVIHANYQSVQIDQYDNSTIQDRLVYLYTLHKKEV